MHEEASVGNLLVSPRSCSSFYATHISTILKSLIFSPFSPIYFRFISCHLIKGRFIRTEASLGLSEKSLVALMAGLIGPRVYSCSNCRTNVALHDDIISKAFQGRNSRAFLFSHAMNIDVGPKEDRNLMTGLHTVADVSCSDCREVLGWKYERAYEESQKYKEGKYILEKSKIVKDNW
ncbi:protein yippee-like At4g27745 isoform X1 [Beta vulgaris subsp. vulgaris]|uniref:protein yippee-like At4g27745 isoform X1 n=2 Tax=Beta vulgaris subsp. vulgaris TaxID=3555 RepID=UPI0020371AC3|nr:protein yippee-like At4g27745 isoform X1 [Beta vulgaris subsp. vulgaris]